MQHTAIEGGGRGSFASYLTGFILAVLLTVLPFALVIARALPPTDTLAATFAAAIIQILVHLHYFLHLDRSPRERWNLIAILFTAAIIAMIAGGSIWIMFDLRARTMERPAMAMMASSPEGRYVRVPARLTRA